MSNIDLTVSSLTARLEMAKENLNREIISFAGESISQDALQALKTTFGSQGFAASIRAAGDYNFYHRFDDDNDGELDAFFIVAAITAALAVSGFSLKQLKDKRKYQELLASVEKVRQVETFLGIKSREEILQICASADAEFEFLQKLYISEELALLEQDDATAYLPLSTPTQLDPCFAEEALLELEKNYVARGIVHKKKWF